MALATIFVITAIITATNATPTIDYPLNSQVPTIARVGQPFAYTFPSSTFSSNSPITYKLSSEPNWLLLDSTTRTLSGTPSTADVRTGAVAEEAIGLTATDSSGSITLNATLAVSSNPAPVVSIPASAQLPAFGVFSGPSTILYHPSTLFKFKFDPGTFSPNGGPSNLSYYAVTADNTPLPSWILFDETSLLFSGQAPDFSSLIQPPQTFGMRLIATDIEDFAAASIVFYIEVGVHLLAFSNAEMSINVTAGSNVSFDGLSNNLQVDGRLANASEITSISMQTPPWLKFDNLTMELTGSAPTNVIASEIVVLATDIYGDMVNGTIVLAVGSSIFSKSIPELNATVGTNFSYNLSTYLSNSSDVYMVANFTPSESWLSFDSPTFELSGQVPTITKPSIITINLTAISKSTHTTGSQSFDFSIISKKKPSSATSSPSGISKSPAAFRTGSTPASAHASPGLSSRIIAAIVIPILVVFAAVIVALFCYRKRRRDAKERPVSPAKSEMSAALENLEAGSMSSVEEIVLPPRVAAPDPLHLDTSGFGDHTHHALTTNEKRISSGKPPGRAIRRSRTTTSIPGTRISERSKRSSSALIESSGNRIRSYSENALSKTDKSWRSTQDSAFPTIRSSRTNSSQGLTRTYSNFSRKGHTRRSARVLSTNLVGNVRESSTTSGQQSGRSILNLTGSSFSVTPLENFTALSRNESMRKTPEPVYMRQRPTPARSKRRQSKFSSAVERRRSGIGHGGKSSISSLSGKNVTRRSVGHGQDWMTGSGQSPVLVRNSRTWLTVADSNRHSSVSASSAYSETYPASNIRMSIRQVAKSPPIAVSKRPTSQSSQASRSSRPVSRRVGSSPFFGGGSTGRDSRLPPKKPRISYADSPTVPEEPTMMGSLESVVLHGLREEDTPPRDSIGIKYCESFGNAREGTRQLKTFIGQLKRTKTKDSIRSTHSRDSRFESAIPSMQSLHQSQHPFIPGQNNEDDYEDYIPDNYSEGSWETHPPSRDSQGMIIEYSDDDSPEVITAAKAAQTKSRPSLVPAARPKSIAFVDPGVDMGPGARMVQGVGRRPVSVDAKATTGSVRAKVERQRSDYSAYI